MPEGLQTATGGGAGVGLQVGLIQAGFQPPAAANPPAQPIGGASGGLNIYASFNAASVLATGTTQGGAALQAGEPDKLTITTPASGAWYQVAASLVVKNASLKGGAVLAVDAKPLKTYVEEAERTNIAALSVGLNHLCVTSPMKNTGGENRGWSVSASEVDLPTELLGSAYSVFLPGGAHTFELRLYNEDRTAEGRLSARRLMVVGP